MIKQQTLNIIKPDATSRRLVGKIMQFFENNNIEITKIKKILLNKEQTMKLYYKHRFKIFFKFLIQYMISNPIIVILLMGTKVIIKNKILLGNTNPKKAYKKTIIKTFAIDIQKNSIHGSDNKKNADREITFFFKYQKKVFE